MKEERIRKGTFKKSAKEFGELYPVLISEDGEVLDGKHRLEEVPNWKKVKLPIKNKRDKLRVTIVSNYHRRTMQPKELRELLNSLAEELTKKLKKEERKHGVDLVWKFLNRVVSHRTIERYLLPEYKMKRRGNLATRAAKFRMYKDTKTWNPFIGCNHRCIYCVPSFQNFWKRKYKECSECQTFTPHQHDLKMPKNDAVFVLGNTDPTFLSEDEKDFVIEEMRHYPEKRFFLQSKDPKCFEKWLPVKGETDEEVKERLKGIHEGRYPEDFRREAVIGIPENTYLLTTLETNRDSGYEKISKAPKPSRRYRDFLNLAWDKKIITIEPIMDFDLDTFVEWIVNIKPKTVFIGYNSHPEWLKGHYPDLYERFEPDPEKVLDFIVALKNKGIRVLLKEMRKMAYKDY